MSGKVVYRIAKICRAFGNAPGNALDITLLGRNSQLLFRKDREQFEFIRLQLLGGIWHKVHWTHTASLRPNDEKRFKD